MNQGLSVVIGMTATYLFSLAGLILAYVYYKKNRHQGERRTDQ